MKYRVYFTATFEESFEFETDETDDEVIKKKADEYLYDCWYNIIDRPDELVIDAIEEW